MQNDFSIKKNSVLKGLIQIKNASHASDKKEKNISYCKQECRQSFSILHSTAHILAQSEIAYLGIETSQGKV